MARDWRIAADWRLRLLFERALDFVPFGYRLHHALERNSTREYLDHVRTQTVPWKIDHWAWLKNQVALDLRGAGVIEIGTGWSGTDLIILHLLGAERIDTLDNVPNLNFNQCLASLDGLAGAEDALGSKLGVTDARRRLIAIPRTTLPAFLAHLRVRTHVGRELSRCEVPAGSADLFYSYSTLHCLPLPELARTLEAAARALRPGALAFTDVRFIDNYCKGQPGMNPFGYLRYPDWMFALLQSRTFNHQSRIRHAHFLDLMRGAGFELVAEKAERLDAALVRSTPLDARFRDLALEELCISNATMIHRLAARAPSSP